MKILSKLLPKREKIGKHFLAVDIGTDFAKAIIFEFNDNVVKVIGFGKHPHGLTDMRGGVIADIAAVSENIEMAVNEASLSCDVRPKAVIFGVSGELSRGLTTTVRLRRENADDPIEKKELQEIFKRVSDASFIEDTKELAELSGDPELNVEIINSRTSEFKVDGYRISDPLGFKGKTLEISHFNAYCPEIHLANVQAAAKNLNLEILTITSLLYALVEAVTFKEPSEFNSIIVDIGGETTDVAVVFGGNILSIKTLSMGSRSLTRAIAGSLDLSFSQAEELKLKFSEGKIESEELGEIKAAVKPVLKLWLSGLELLLKEFEGVKKFPAKMILAGGGSSLSEIREVIISHPWTSVLPFEGFPKIKTIEKKNYPLLHDEANKVSTLDEVTSMSLGIIGWQLKEQRYDRDHLG